MLVTLSANILGPSGMNALAHCAEALWAPKSDPITDLHALGGAARISRHLVSALAGHDGSRDEVLLASCLAGLALGTAGTSLHHGLCHLQCGMFDTSHAETHAILLPYVIEYLHPAAPIAFERLAEATGSAPHELAERIWTLAQSAGAPDGLKALGITEAREGCPIRAIWSLPHLNTY